MKKIPVLAILALGAGMGALAGESITFQETYTEYLTNDAAGDVVLAGKLTRRFSAKLTFPEAGCVHLQSETMVGFSLDEDGYGVALGSADNLPNTEYNLVLRDELDQPFGRMTIRRAYSTLFITGTYTRPGESLLSNSEGDAERIAGSGLARVWLGDFLVERILLFSGRQTFTTAHVGEGETVELRSHAVSGAVDFSRPTLSITSHKSTQRIFTNSIELRGFVRNHRGEAYVYGSLNGIDLPEVGADEYGAWSLPIELAVGTNVISIWAINILGNVSATNNLRLFRAVPAKLTVTWDGGGTVSGPTNGQLLEIGRNYRITARPAAGMRFGGWHGGGNDADVHSPAATLTFTMQPGMSVHASFIPPTLAPLTLEATAGNAVLGVTNGQLLEVGRTYQAIARPGPSNVFLHWAGSVPSSNATLRFIMESNTVLQANFASNPWRSIAGRYSGVLFDAPEDSRDPPLNSGTFVLTLSANGRFSGKLRLRNQEAAPFSGRAGLDGVANVTVSRPGCRDPMQWLLWFDVENGSLLLGECSSPWTGGFLIGSRPTGGATYAGRYTFRIGSNETGPAGDGAGSLTIDHRGQVIMTGTMGDGAAFALATVVSQFGSVLIHAPLYANRGFFQGQFVANTSGIHTDLIVLGTSEFSWFKPPAVTDRLYPGGFMVLRTVEAVRYTPPQPGFNMLPWTNGVLALSGGELPDYFESSTQVMSNAVTVADNPFGVSVTLAPRTGLFTIRFAHPVAGQTVTGKGALLQYDPLGGITDFPPIGAGWFRGIHESGYVRLLPAP